MTALMSAFRSRFECSKGALSSQRARAVLLASVVFGAGVSGSAAVSTNSRASWRSCWVLIFCLQPDDVSPEKSGSGSRQPVKASLRSAALRGYSFNLLHTHTHTTSPALLYGSC